MKHLWLVVAAAVLVLAGTAACAAGAQKVPESEAKAWIRYTVPLPKSIEIPEKVSVVRGAVAVIPPPARDQVIDQAVKELNEALGGALAAQEAFRVTMVIGGPEAEPLKVLKNSSQAYRIFPAGERELKLAALTSRGLYYAAKTLQQLVKGRSTQASVEIPLLTVTDWPDLEERGLWGSDNFDHLRWMADRKMNLVEQISAHSVEKDGTIKTGLKAGREPMVTEGPLYGINPVPVVLHLEQSIGGRGAYVPYPYLKGKSEHPGVACYSQPKTVEIIAQWIAGLSKLPNVTDVDVWMSENLQGKKGCQCDLCKATGVDPVVLESRAIIKAWKMAEQIAGKKIGLRMLTSEATEDFNKQIFAELPPDVKVIYYHSLLTYTSGRQPLLWRPYLEEFAKSGRWLGVCPSMSGGAIPFTSAAFMHYRCKEFVDKGLSCVMGYATPRVHFTFFNVDAAAEYSWNLNGRSTREFAASYAVRNGYKDPEKFAEFAELIGPVEWDYLGSDWPWRADDGLMQDPLYVRLKKGTIPDLGFVLWDFLRFPFGNVTSVKQLYGNVGRASRAMRLAKQMGMEQYIQESRVAHGFAVAQRATYDLRRVVRRGRIADEDRDAARRYFREFVGGLREACDALPKWELTVRRPTDPEGFSGQCVQFVNEKMIQPMIATARELGIDVKWEPGIMNWLAGTAGFLIMASAAVSAPCAPRTVSASEEKNWIRCTVPLPKQISIAGKVSVPAGSVAIAAPADAPRLVQCAVNELAELVGRCSGKPAFTIAVVLGGKQAEPLRKLKNSGQACRIAPAGKDRLEIFALEPHGIYYGAKTLQQLINARKKGGSIEMPLVSMTDWPDMEARGLWGGDNYEHLKWLGDRKMNWMEQISAVGVDENGRLYARPQTGRMVMFADGPNYGINAVPVIGHIAGMAAMNDEAVLKAFPKAKGRSGHAGVMCYSQPESVEILTQWMVQLAALPNVTGIDQWLTENLHGEKGCRCGLCAAAGVDPMVLEARAVIAAWREAEKRIGRKIDLRVLTSEETEPFNEQIFRELPPGVKIVYYHSLLTYNCIRAPQIQKYVEDWAKAGNWVAVCSNISTYPRVWSPFDAIQFIRCRVGEFVEKGLSGLLGYAIPRVNYNRVNVEAAAEYSWNLKGRSEREFAVSWAVREGLKDPEKAADYLLAVGQVLWDCHGSEWPHRAFQWVDGTIDEKLMKGTIPGFGKHSDGWLAMPFGSIESEKRLYEDVALADKALKLAREMRNTEFVEQARFAKGLIGSIRALYELKLLAPRGAIADDRKPEAQKWFQSYVDNLRDACDALPKWEVTVRKNEPEGLYAPHTIKIINEELIDRMIAAARKMGCEVK